MRTWIDPVYGYMVEQTGRSLGVKIPEDDVCTALRLVEAALMPCRADIVRRELARLRATTISRDAGEDLPLIMAAYTEALAEYPEDVVLAVCRAGRQKFWPALAELIEPANCLVAERLWWHSELTRRLQQLRSPYAADMKLAITQCAKRPDDA